MINQTVTLNNGVKMPVLGLGVYLATDAKEMQNAVRYAMEAGYRSFDTAQMYHNEELLGEALELSGVPRKEYFLTSKVDTCNMGYENTRRTFQESLKKLKTDYFDLFLIHWPGQRKERLIESWRALEEFYKEGKARAIGVCNCLPRHLNWIMEECEVVPALNQIERHPLWNPTELFAWCKERGIQPEAWAPLIRGSFDIPQIQELAAKYKKTGAQIILRWDVQSGYMVIPKSVHKDRIIENADIFDFELEEEDMKLIDGLHTGFTTGWDLETYDYE